MGDEDAGLRGRIRRARSGVEQYVVEDGFAYVGVESRERVLCGV